MACNGAQNDLRNHARGWVGEWRGHCNLAGRHGWCLTIRGRVLLETVESLIVGRFSQDSCISEKFIKVLRFRAMLELVTSTAQKGTTDTINAMLL